MRGRENGNQVPNWIAEFSAATAQPERQISGLCHSGLAVRVDRYVEMVFVSHSQPKDQIVQCKTGPAGHLKTVSASVRSITGSCTPLNVGNDAVIYLNLSSAHVGNANKGF